MELQGDVPAHHAEQQREGHRLRSAQRPLHHAEPERHAASTGERRGLGPSLQT